MASAEDTDNIVEFEFDTAEFDPREDLAADGAPTCVAYFHGGPLNGCRAEGFVYDENYRSGNSFYAWPTWRILDPNDPEAVELVGHYQYKIDVASSDTHRVINCTNQGFQRA